VFVVEILGGLALLILGGDSLVRGAVALALRLGVSRLVIGLTIIGFGTSVPELLLSVESALLDHPEMALGNVVGSNIANILLVLGFAAAVAPVETGGPGVRRNVIAMVGSALLFVVFAHGREIVVWQGAFMIVLLVAMTFGAYQGERRAAASNDNHGLSGVTTTPGRNLAFILTLLVAGLALLATGATLLIEGALEAARLAGVPDAIIGLTLLAVGSSLPELAACVAAAVRREPGLALGNVLGSNIINILGAVGLIALIGPVPVEAGALYINMWIMLGLSVGLAAYAFAGKTIGRLVGYAALTSYAGYVAVHFTGLP
jgi:cation:H+ antiporter